MNYINAKYAEVSVSDVAKYIGITSRYLANIFKEMSNSSPKQYITERRMKKAEELITTTEIPMKEIAKIVGYEDPLSFSKSYKAYAAYRRSSIETPVSKQKTKPQRSDFAASLSVFIALLAFP